MKLKKGRIKMIKESEAPDTLSLRVHSDINNDLDKNINYYREDLIIKYRNEVVQLTRDLLERVNR